MTITITEKGFIDRFLALIGKKRAIRISGAVYEKYGPYAYAKAEKESFWRALIRSKYQKPPAGWIYPENF